MKSTEIIKTDYFRENRVDVIIIDGVEYWIVDQIARALEYRSLERLYLNIMGRWGSDFKKGETLKIPKTVIANCLSVDIGLDNYSYVLCVNEQGLLKILKHARKNTMSFLDFLKASGLIKNDIVLMNNVKELEFKEFLEHALDDIATILHQFKIEIKNKKYIIDFYLPESNVVIEFDEYHHKDKITYDDKRQQEITDYLKCKFIRIEEDEDYGFAINKILKAILHNIGLQRGIGRWTVKTHAFIDDEPEFSNLVSFETSG